MSPVNAIKLTERQAQAGLGISQAAIRKLNKLNLLRGIQTKSQNRYPLNEVMELSKWLEKRKPLGLSGLVVQVGAENGGYLPLPWCVGNRSDKENSTIERLTAIVKVNPTKYGHVPPNSAVTKGLRVSADTADYILGKKLLGSYAGFIACSATILMEVSEAYDGHRYFIVLPDTTDMFTKWYSAPATGPTATVLLP